MYVKGIPIEHLLSLTPDVQNSSEFKSAIAIFDAGRITDTSPELKNPDSIYSVDRKEVLIKALSWMVDYNIDSLPFKIREEVEALIVMMVENSLNLCTNFAAFSDQALRDIYNPANEVPKVEIELSYTNRSILLREADPWWFGKLKIPSVPTVNYNVETDYSNGIWSGYIDSWNKTSVPLFQEGLLLQKVQFKKMLDVQYKPVGGKVDFYTEVNYSDTYTPVTYPFSFKYLDYDKLYSDIVMKFNRPDINIDGFDSSTFDTKLYFTEMYSKKKLLLNTPPEEALDAFVLSEPDILSQIKTINLLDGAYRYVNNI